MSISRDLDEIAQKHKPLLQNLLNCMSFSVDVGVALEQFEEKEKVGELEQIMKSYVELENQLKHHITALELLRDEFNHSRHQLDQVDLPSLLEDKKRVIAPRYEKIDFSKHGKFKEFKQKVWHVHHPSQALPEEENEELVVMTQQSEMSFTCPITKLELKDPVRNTSCGHVYSREGAYSLLNRSKRHREAACPIPGCSSKFNSNNLESDPDTERKLKLRKRQAPQKEATQDDEEYEEIE